MASIDLSIVGEFITRGFSFYYPDYQETGFRPTEVEDPNEVGRLVLSVPKSSYCLALRTYDGSSSHIMLLARQKELISGDFTIEADNEFPRIKAKVNGVFKIEIENPDDAKYLKKQMKAGLGFAITDVHFQREELGPTPFGMEGGVIDGIDWESYEKMPQAQLMGTDMIKLDAKAQKSRAKPLLKVPIKVDLKVPIEKAAFATTEQAVKEGLRLLVGLGIKGGSNTFIVKPEQIVGSCSIYLKKQGLGIQIDGYVEFQEDGWVRKYKDQAPFIVTLDSYWDSEGNTRYLGEYNSECGYYESVVVGLLSMK